ncbi:MAG: SH3 domain-containing protein [Acidobacteria bacterium]|nr:SH3 domain-containing protein [Acidobacteriota bacterium]
MKECPACKTTYTDDSLRFCLSDGTALTALSDDEPTVVRRTRNDSLRVDMTPEREDVVRPEKPSGSSTWIKILVALLILGVIALLGLGLAGAAFYYGTGVKPPETPVKTPSSAPSVTPTVDPEKEKLRDELANIQKKLDEQKKAPLIKATPDPSLTTTVTANSPADGFLALRSEPNSETGKRIFKIPHGAKLQIGACGDYITTQKNNYGRWCRAAYAGYSGWVFDKYVIY